MNKILKVEDDMLYSKYKNQLWLNRCSTDIAVIEHSKYIYETTLEEMAAKCSKEFGGSKAIYKKHFDSICRYAYNIAYRKFDCTLYFYKDTGDFMYQFTETEEEWNEAVENIENYWYGRELYGNKG